VLATLNVALRFFLELAGIVAVTWWGVHVADGTLGWIVGIAAAVLFIVAWGLFIAPRARYPQPPRIRLIGGTVLLLGSAVLLAASGAVVAGTVLAVLVALNAIGLVVLGDGGLSA
jgi:CHASE2 domain-containing sensor protein